MKKIIHILFAPFRAIKNRLLDSIIKRANITYKTISNTLLNELSDFQYELVQAVAEKIDMDDIIGGLDYSALGYEVDECELASHLETSDIAYEISNNHLSTRDVADEIDLDRLANIVKLQTGTDLEAFNSRLDEIDAKQVDDSKYNDLVKTIKDLENFVHEMQDEHKENYVRHTNRFQLQDDELNYNGTELEENCIRINKNINDIYKKIERFVSRQWILDAIEARAIELDEKINATLASTKDLYEPELKAFRVTFMDDFEAIDEKEAYDQLISYCEEVYRNQDVTAFNFEELND